MQAITAALGERGREGGKVDHSFRRQIEEGMKECRERLTFNLGN